MNRERQLELERLRREALTRLAEDDAARYRSLPSASESRKAIRRPSGQLNVTSTPGSHSERLLASLEAEDDDNRVLDDSRDEWRDITREEVLEWEANEGREVIERAKLVGKSWDTGQRNDGVDEPCF